MSICLKSAGTVDTKLKKVSICYLSGTLQNDAAPTGSVELLVFFFSSELQLLTLGHALQELLGPS